jgi:hypothetical protein
VVVLTMALVMAAMMLAMAMPAFAQPGGSENSCGASNPNIAVPPGQGDNRVGPEGDEFLDCGFRNNPHHVPPGHQDE